MLSSILTTKLYTPRAPPNLVARPRLTQRLDSSLRQNRPLILVVAPAGYGKTTLVAEWLSKTSVPSVWLALDEADNDPARFFTYLLAALRTRNPTAFQSLLDGLRAGVTSAEAFVTPLVNELAAADRPLILVLDDYHVISDAVVREAIAFLIDHTPPNLHLVVLSRADPALPLPRLRVREAITEIRDRDLRFTLDEMTDFLNATHRLNLPAEQIRALDTRTEGWPAGVQLAALSLRECGPEHAAQFIQTFSGSHHYIIDYLAQEVLRRLPADVLDFLLRTSILERLTAPLCEAVTANSPSKTGPSGQGPQQAPGRARGGAPSQVLLEQLASDNLFLRPLDDQRRWYRYHPLFVDLLRQRLTQAFPDEAPCLHERASLWYEQNGMGSEAVMHALAAGDLERVVRLMSGRALAMMDLGDWRTLASWLDGLPGAVIRCRPRLCVARAWIMVCSGQFEAALPYLEAAEAGQAAGTEGDPAGEEAQSLAGHVATLRAYVASLHGDVGGTIHHARLALKHLHQDDQATRSLVAKDLGLMLRVSGDLPGASRVLAEAAAEGRAAGDRFATVFLLAELALLNLVQGRLHCAHAACCEALGIAEQYVHEAGRDLPTVSYVYPVLSWVLYEWNDLQSAVRHAQKGVEFCRLWGQVEALADNRIALAAALAALGEARRALTVIAEGKRDSASLSNWYVALMEQHEASIRWALGDQAAAERWALGKELRAESELKFADGPVQLVVARTMLGQRRWGEAQALLDRLVSLEAGAGAWNMFIQALVLKAVALQGMRKPEEALVAMGEALARAEPEGYVRTFLDAGEPVARLLRRAAARGVGGADVGKLLALFGPDGANAVATPASRDPAPDLIEPLSARELEVLHLVAEGLANREIAERLVVSLPTVKKHVENIHGKLGVRSRTQAVARARSLNLL